MAVITLTTDFGHKDPYLASVKGTILSGNPSANLVDVSHDIEKFDILEASYILDGCWRSFPEGTVHLVSVNGSSGTLVQPVALRYGGHFFTGIDNGIFSLVLGEDTPEEVVRLAWHGSPALPARDVLAPAAAALAAGKSLAELGERIPDIERKRTLQAFSDQNSISGRVVYLDSFENAITNVSSELFNAVCRGRNFTITLKQSRGAGYGPTGNSIELLSSAYSDVEEGEVLALFNSGGRLEIAINKGNAGGLLGLRPGEIVKIEFE